MGFGMQWHQLDHMQTVCTLRQTDNHTDTLFTGPGKCVSWNLFGNDADTDAKIYLSAHLCSVFEQFLCYFFTACDSDGHILQYGCCCHTIYRYG